MSFLYALSFASISKDRDVSIGNNAIRPNIDT